MNTRTISILIASILMLLIIAGCGDPDYSNQNYQQPNNQQYDGQGQPQEVIVHHRYSYQPSITDVIEAQQRQQRLQQQQHQQTMDNLDNTFDRMNNNFGRFNRSVNEANRMKRRNSGW